MIIMQGSPVGITHARLKNICFGFVKNCLHLKLRNSLIERLACKTPLCLATP